MPRSLSVSCRTPLIAPEMPNPNRSWNLSRIIPSNTARTAARIASNSAWTTAFGATIWRPRSSVSALLTRSRAWVRNGPSACGAKSLRYHAMICARGVRTCPGERVGEEVLAECLGQLRLLPLLVLGVHPGQHREQQRVLVVGPPGRDRGATGREVRGVLHRQLHVPGVAVRSLGRQYRWNRAGHPVVLQPAAQPRRPTRGGEVLAQLVDRA